MARVLVLYASVEGQTARIAGRIAETLAGAGHLAELRSAKEPPADLAAFDAVMVGASVHYGRHPRYLLSLLRGLRRELAARPGAFFSVSLSGGGPGANPAAARRYLTAFLAQAGWQPRYTFPFAGALRYSRYGTFKKILVRGFVWLAGGDTDASRDYEYTDYDAVASFARAFATALAR